MVACREVDDDPFQAKLCETDPSTVITMLAAVSIAAEYETDIVFDVMFRVDWQTPSPSLPVLVRVVTALPECDTDGAGQS